MNAEKKLKQLLRQEERCLLRRLETGEATASENLPENENFSDRLRGLERADLSNPFLCLKTVCVST